MNQESPSFSLALKLWWAIFWRTIPLAFVLAFIIGFVVGFFGHIFQVPVKALEVIGGVGGFIGGLYVSLWVILRLLTKGFGIYRLVVVRK